MRISCQLFFSLILLLPAIALGWIKPEESELTMTAPDWCPDADAVVLDKSTDYELRLTSSGWLLRGTQSVRIKILKESGKERGNYRIPEPFDGKIKTVNARTISPDGSVVKVKSGDIFKKRIFVGDNRESRINVQEFAFPMVAVGSILEVNWDTYSERVVFIDPFYFDEENLPTRTSRFAFTIPGIVRYLISQMNCQPFSYRTNFENSMTSDGQQVTFTAQCEKIDVDLTKPYSPGQGYERPHLFMVFTNVHVLDKDIDIVPDWAKAAEFVIKSYEQFGAKCKDADAIVQAITASSDTTPVVERLFRWVADSIEFVDSRYFWDFDGKMDDKLRDRKATSIEKILILQKLCDIAGAKTVPVILVPTDESPGVTKLPALTQFRQAILGWTHAGTTTYLDPTEKSAPFGLLPWRYYGAIALPLYDDIEGLATLATPKEKSRVLKEVTCTLDESGTLSGHTAITLTDQYTLSHRHLSMQTDSTELKKAVAERLGGDLTWEQISLVSVRDDSTDQRKMYVDFDFRKADFAQGTGGDRIISPNFIEAGVRDALPPDQHRTTNIRAGFPRNSMVNLRINLPESLAAADTAWKAAANLREQITYRATLTSENSGRTLVYQRQFKRETDSFQKTDYDQLRNTLNEIADQDHKQFVLQSADLLIKR